MRRKQTLGEHTVVHDGQPRIYLTHAPQDEGAGCPRDVVVVLHGGGGSAAFASRVHGWRELSSETGCLVVFPEAECGDPARPAGVRENPRVWNDGGSRSAVARRKVDDIGYLARVLDDVRNRYSVNTQHIFVTGFSSGGSMSFRVGVELADQVAAIAPVAGHLCIRDPRPARPLSMFYLIGLDDPLSPFAGGQALSPWGVLRDRPPVMDSIHTWIDLVGASRHPVTLHDSQGVRRVRYGPGPGGQEVQLCTIAGQGHEWPGARRTLPVSISGPQTDKLCATRAVWDFFQQVTGPADAANTGPAIPDK
jgi:polyhydroxybutyrate depolymerase